ncbi:MAG: MBOAT family O-acyltransferase [Paracoccaceae bacterium]
MVFSSLDFLFVFLPVFLVVYAVGGRAANAILLAASLVFYATGEGVFLAVLLVSIALNAGIGRQIAGSEGQARTRWLGLGLALNLGLLGWFKYAGFLTTDVFGFDPESGIGAGAAAIHLPLGISFFTFQAISYLVDIHRGTVAAERSTLRLGTYIAMFPQLIAGPIVRFESVAKALHARSVDLRHLYYGLAFFATGLAMKVLIADGVAPIADAVFAENPAQLRADTALLGTLAYTAQIYFDFAGYSSMAIGLGLVLGFRFPQNFDFPYVARSVTEFWRRWHMSLSSWFRDYLYIPLGGNRHGAWRTYRNLAIVFLATGLWHGAAWTFVLWGAFHGAFLILERIGLGRLLERAPAGLAHGVTLVVVMAGWVLFRAEDLGHAGGVYAAFLRLDGPVVPAAHLSTEGAMTLFAAAAFAGPWIGRGIAGAVALPRYGPWPEPLRPGPVAMGLVLWIALIALSSAKLLAGSYSPFIYFRF